MEKGLEVYGGKKVDLSVFKQETNVSEEDKAKVREYAKLMEAQEALVKQMKKMAEMINMLDAKWCKKHLWVNARGEAVPIFDLEDDYLKNIVAWLKRNEREIPKEIKKEYYSRFGYESLAAEVSEYEPAKHKRAQMFVGDSWVDNDPWDE